jgi:signal transduction histidine kinase
MRRGARSPTVGVVRIAVARVVSSARRHPVAVDALVAVILAGLALLSVHIFYDDALGFDPTLQPPSNAAMAVAMLAPALPLALRRRSPLVAAVLVSVGFMLGRQVFDVYEPAVSVLILYLGIYSAARHGRPPWRTVGLLLAVGLSIGEIVYELVIAPGDAFGAIDLFLLIYNVVIVLAPWWLGSTMRSRQRREEELVAQAAELQRSREENARRAVFEERVRIARELHDVVAHHVSVMGIQAAAARRVLDQRPDAAEEALVAIEAASRQAVLEMDRLLGYLRREGEVDDLAPQPGIGDLEELVADVRRAGLSIELRVEGEPSNLPRTVEVSAYRIVQEALTNTLKHSGSARVSVQLRYGDDALEVEVDDDGLVRSSPAAQSGGHGLIGMRERVGLHGGHLRVGPRPHGGFGVHARLPFDGRT